jgi:pSer/pThr/pTyr-binding forkhead associated (FHA) protein
MARYGGLVIQLPSGDTTKVALEAPEISIGRGLGNDIEILDPKMSRQHLRVLTDGSQAEVMDRGSTRKFTFQGKKVERAILQHGQSLVAGQTTLTFLARDPVSGDLSKMEWDDETEATEVGDATGFLEKSLADHRSARLVIIQPNLTREMPIRMDTSLTLGRSADDCDVVVDHPKVSRAHCTLTLVGDSRLLVQDLGSTNGIMFRGKKRSRVTLETNENVVVGNAQVIFKAPFHNEELSVVAAPGDQEAPLPPQMRDAKKGRAIKRGAGRQPVVVIPGFMGSTLHRGDEVLWPTVKAFLKNPEVLRLPEVLEGVEPRDLVGEVVVIPGLFKLDAYSRLVTYLEESLGYQRDVDLFVFAWDWRRDMRHAARELGESIAAWQDVVAKGSGKFVLMGHSAGCVVARYYVENMGGRHHVDRLIFMGGPHQGTAKPLATLFGTNRGMLSLKKDTLKEVMATFPCAYQLLPTVPVIFEEDGKTPVDMWNDLSWAPRQAHPLIKDAREFHDELRSKSRIPVVSIFGYGQKTVERVLIKRGSDGLVKSATVQETLQGDGTVLQDSAILPGSEIHPVQQMHGALYTDSDVKMRLRLELVGHP